MKDLIQKDILSANVPSDVSLIQRCFGRYNKFLVSEPLTEDKNDEYDLITLIFFDGPKDHWKFDEERGHYLLDAEKGGTRDFHLANIEIPKGTEVPRDLWIETKDFEMPTIKMPTIADVLALPTLSTESDIGHFIENGLDEFMRCGQWDLDMEKVYAEFSPRIVFEEVLKRTTDYGKYGQITYRIHIDGGVVGVACRHGRYLDTVSLYPTDLAYLKKFVSEMEEACYEDRYGTDTKTYTVDEEVTFLDDEILDALYNGVQTNEGN